MSLPELCSAIGSVLIALRGVQNSGHFLRNVSLFRTAHSQLSNLTPSRHFFLIIPALREQAILKDTMDYFANFDFDKRYYTIIIATTRKEAYDHAQNRARLPELAENLSHNTPLGKVLVAYAGVFDRVTLSDIHTTYVGKAKNTILLYLQSRHDNYTSTGQLAHKIANTLNRQAHDTNFVKVIEYPYEHGHMVHQINYVVSVLQAQLKPQDYIGIYNADSRPARNTLRVAENNVQSRVKHGESTPAVMQQSSLFTLNLLENTQRYNAAWRANAFHQSMWTMKHDVTMRRLQSSHVLKLQNKPSFWQQIIHTRFAVCTGHGLYINAAHYNALPLPQDSVVEDAAYGMLQCLSHVPITQLYTLENSETPTSLRSVINQKRVWFKLVFDLFKIQHNAYRNRQQTGSSVTEILVLNARILPIYFLWFFHSIFTIVPLALALWLHSPALLGLWILAMVLYWLIPAAILDSQLPVLVGQPSIGLLRVLRIFVLGMPGILSHSIGPWLSIYDVIREKFGITIEKKKTER